MKVLVASICINIKLLYPKGRSSRLWSALSPWFWSVILSGICALFCKDLFITQYRLVSSRLCGNSWDADLWSPCLPSGENQTVPAVDEGANLCSRLHCSCHYFWSLCHSHETQAMKMDQSQPSTRPLDQILSGK